MALFEFRPHGMPKGNILFSQLGVTSFSIGLILSVSPVDHCLYLS